MKAGNKEQADSVYYEGVFGSDTAIKYTPLFSGFKEDIVLYNNRNNVFTFILKLNGLKSKLLNGCIQVINPIDGAIVATIDAVYVYDSFNGTITKNKDEGSFPHNTWNNITELKELDDGNYLVSIIVDKDFLDNPETVYPVYVDPTITIYSSGSGSSKTIMDVPIYNGSGAQNLASGANTFNLVGFVGNSGGVNYGTGRTLVRSPGLFNNLTFASLRANHVTNLSLYYYEVSGISTNATIGANYYTGPVWTESTANYTNTSWNGYGSLINSQTFGGTSQNTVVFNLTSAVATWKNDSTAASRGIMLRNLSSESNGSYRKDFRSTESSSSKPYISVTYTIFGCKPYVQQNSQTINCHGYAFFTNNWPSFITNDDYNYMINPSTTTAQMLDRTKARMVTWLNSNFSGRWEEVTSAATLNTNQWLIVMRVGKKIIAGNMVYDYHYWYRTDNGQWANKHGSQSSVLLPVSDTPSTNSSSGWALGGYSPFYDSSIVYYRVTE